MKGLKQSLQDQRSIIGIIKNSRGREDTGMTEFIVFQEMDLNEMISPDNKPNRFCNENKQSALPTGHGTFRKYLHTFGILREKIRMQALW